MDNEKLDDILGITRCVRCGHRLEGEVECPFCSLFPDTKPSRTFRKLGYLTACFLTSPLSIYFVARNRNLTIVEKIMTSSGCFLWLGLFLLWF